MAKAKNNDLVSNRKAFHNYEVLDTLEAGIVLQGTEIKSLRDHGGNLQDAFIIIDNNEAFLKNASIAPYKFGNTFNHTEKRTRKLLLHKKEISKFKKALEQKGLTIIPLSMYLKKGYVKVKIATARGKKKYDKREAVKKREQSRSIERSMKEQ